MILEVSAAPLAVKYLSSRLEGVASAEDVERLDMAAVMAIARSFMLLNGIVINGKGYNGIILKRTT